LRAILFSPKLKETFILSVRFAFDVVTCFFPPDFTFMADAEILKQVNTEPFSIVA